MNMYRPNIKVPLHGVVYCTVYSAGICTRPNIKVPLHGVVYCTVYSKRICTDQKQKPPGGEGTMYILKFQVT